MHPEATAVGTLALDAPSVRPLVGPAPTASLPRDPFSVASPQFHGGSFESATHVGQAGQPGCGPWMRLGFQVAHGIVQLARWESYGCPVAMACGEVVCAISEGRELERIRALTAEDVVRLVGGVPEGKEHCPGLAAAALHALTSACWPGGEARRAAG